MGQAEAFGGGRYELAELVGQGGVGAVYRALQQPLGREVALKILRPEVARDAGIRRRFTQEARAVASLSHPSIATVFDFGVEDDETLYMAMEFIRGQSLLRLLERGVAPGYLLAILDPVLAALAYAHARGVIHRDIKPDNIVIGHMPETTEPPSLEVLAQQPQLVKLVDFGIAVTRGLQGDGSQTTEGEVVGTPLYMAPEQARGVRALTPAVDLYAMGVMLFEGLTGRHPFTGIEPDETPMDVMVRHIAMPVPEIIAPAGIYLPESLKAVVRRCLEKAPEARFSSAAALREALLESALLLRAHDPNLQTNIWASGGPLSLADTTDPALLITSPRPLAARITQPRLTPVESIGRAPEVRFEVPLVGRQAERRRLESTAALCLRENAGRVVLLEGEAGVGKTKLAMWLKESVLEAGRMRSVQGAFLREGSGLRGLRDALEGLLGVRHVPREALEEPLERRLRSWGSDDRRDRRDLTEFLRPEGTPGPLGPDGQGPLFALLTRVLEKASRSKPLLVILDDIQWAGPELGDFLEYLAVEFRYRVAPLVVVCTVRSEDLPENPALSERLRRLSRYDGETIARIHLERMAEEDSRALAQRLLPLADTLQAKLIRRAAGNPLHLVQLLQYLYEEGALRWAPEREVFDGNAEHDALHEIPPSLVDLIELRLAQIERHCQTDGLLGELLGRCAVLGGTFSFTELSALIDEEEEEALADFLDLGVDLLLREAVLRQLKGGLQETLRFNHDLMRHVLLERMPLPKRARLHDAAGRALEKIHADRLDAVAVSIAYHAVKANQRERAQDFLLRSALVARAGHRLSDAEELFARALEHVLAWRTADDPVVLKIERRMGDLQLKMGRFDDAERTYAQVMGTILLSKAAQANQEAPLLASPRWRLLVKALSASPRLQALCESARQDLIRSVYGAARIARHKGHQDAAEQLASAGQRLATQAGLGPWARLGTVLAGWMAWERGDYDQAQELGQGALNEALAHEDAYNRADALHLLAEVARRRGDPARTAELLVQARQAYEILDDRQSVARCQRDLAQLARARQDLENAARLFVEARRRFEDLGDRHAVASCFNGLGEVARFMERFPVARECYQRAFETFKSIGARTDAAMTLVNLGLTAMAQDDLERAEVCLVRAEGLLGDIELPYVRLGLELNKGLLQARRQQWSQAQESLVRAQGHIERHGIADPDYARPLGQIGGLFLAAGFEERGQALMAQAQEMWTRLGRR